MRIEDGTMTGIATIARAYAIGRDACKACQDETPLPPQAVLDNLALGQSTISTVWPFEHWIPVGWMRIAEYGSICPSCARAVMFCLGNRTPNQRRSVAGHDFMIAKMNIERALDLAKDGLLTEFPRDPKPGEIDERWSHVYGHDLRMRYYRESEFRDRIRAIHNALVGMKS